MSIPLIEIEKGVVMKLSHDPLGKLSLTQVPPFLEYQNDNVHYKG